MSKIKHTPGPWAISYSSKGVPLAIDAACPGFKMRTLVANIPKAGWNEKDTEANAKLIAAAPELLEALKWALEELDRLNADSQDISIEEQSTIAHSIIQKATL